MKIGRIIKTNKDKEQVNASPDANTPSIGLLEKYGEEDKAKGTPNRDKYARYIPINRVPITSNKFLTILYITLIIGRLSS